MKRKNNLIFMLVISGAMVAYSQKKETYSSQQWIQYYNTTQLNDKWSLGVDGGMRYKEWNKYEYIARIGLYYQFPSKIKVGGGVVTTGKYTGNDVTRKEFRTYQEVTTSWKQNKVTINHRFRFEQRSFVNTPTDLPVTHNFNFRLRYQIGFNIPLFTLSKENTYKKISLVVSDEIFINAGKQIIYNYVDHNRLVVGPAWQVSKSLAVAISYMSQFSQKTSSGLVSLDDVVWVTIRHNLSLKK